ncbi:MAG: hypothetical protein ACOC8F_05640 [Planctomycetota bacterium]
MKAREVLGVDFTGDRVLAVQLRRESAGPVVTHCAAREIPGAASGAPDAATIGEALRRLLADGGFTARSAVLTVPAGRGFVQQVTDATADLDPEQYVHQARSDPDGRQVRAVALRSDVDRMRQVAAQADLDLDAVTLRTLGCLRAVAAGAGETGGARIAVVAGRRVVTLLLTVDGRLVAAHTRTRQPHDESAGRLERYVRVAGLVAQMVHLLTTVHDEARGAPVDLVVNEDERDAARGLGERLGVEVRPVVPGADEQVRWADDAGAEARADSAAALGAALQGLEAPPAAAETTADAERPRWRVNLLRRPAPRRRLRMPSWRRAAIIVAAVGVAAIAALGVWAAVESARLDELRRRHADQADQAERHRRLLAHWRRLRPWRCERADGTRIPLSDRLATATELFPRDQARAATLKLSRRDGAMSLYVEGRAAPHEDGDDPVYAFAERLNASPAFGRATPGAITEVSDPNGYTRQFSVTAETREP